MPVVARFHHKVLGQDHPGHHRNAITDSEAAKAAKKIQDQWRKKRTRSLLHERSERLKNIDRTKPWGFYTHSLALTSRAQKSLPDIESAASTRRWFWLLLEEPSSSTSAQVLSLVIIGIILVSIAGFILETVPTYYLASPGAWALLEVVCTSIFTLEYLARLAVCEEGSVSQLRFVIEPKNVFDLVAVVPFYIELVLRSTGAQDTPVLRIFRLVRLVRVFRIFKLGRYNSGMKLFGEAIVGSSTALSVLVFLLCMGVVLFSSALYYVEKLSCPEVDELTSAEASAYAAECGDLFNRGVSPRFGLCCTEESSPLDFPSIVSTFWWSLVTMTSVGYGEVYPRTTQGKCVAFFAMLVGMILIALPVAIVGQKFQDVYDNRDLEEAKRRAAVRMKVMGEVWSLVPPSDVIPKLRKVKLKDAALGNSVAELTTHLEEVWEQREQLMRERKYEFERQEQILQNVGKLLSSMETVCGGQDDR